VERKCGSADAGEPSSSSRAEERGTGQKEQGDLDSKSSAFKDILDAESTGCFETED